MRVIATIARANGARWVKRALFITAGLLLALLPERSRSNADTSRQVLSDVGRFNGRALKRQGWPPMMTTKRLARRIGRGRLAGSFKLVPRAPRPSTGPVRVGERSSSRRTHVRWRRR